MRARWQAANLRWPKAALTIELYGRAVRPEFTDSELIAVSLTRESISPSTDPDVHAAVPPESLLHLALGNCTLPEVLDAWPDCLLRDHLTNFLTTAFPGVEVRVWQRN